MPERLIDTHLHVWNFGRAEYSWLRNDTSILGRSYHIEEIEQERKTARVSEGILVQAANNMEETAWMLEVAAHTPWINGVVGWVPLTDPEATEDVLQNEYLDNPYFKGVRHLIHDEPDPSWLLQPAVLESLQLLADYNLPYDFVGVLTSHIRTALAVAEKVPKLKMVFNHLNQPPIATGEKYGEWGELMQEAAKHPQFYGKVSGHGNTAKKPDWSTADIEPYVAFALEQFGEDRLFCGSNWPVSLLAGDYIRTWDIYKEVINSLCDKDGRHKLYYTNAAGFYQLDPRQVH